MINLMYEIAIRKWNGEQLGTVIVSKLATPETSIRLWEWSCVRSSTNNMAQQCGKWVGSHITYKSPKTSLKSRERETANHRLQSRLKLDSRPQQDPELKLRTRLLSSRRMREMPLGRVNFSSSFSDPLPSATLTTMLTRGLKQTQTRSSSPWTPITSL